MTPNQNFRTSTPEQLRAAVTQKGVQEPSLQERVPIQVRGLLPGLEAVFQVSEAVFPGSGLVRAAQGLFF